MTKAAAAVGPVNEKIPSKAAARRLPKRSLRTILLIWFLVLSIVPLMFVTGYSLAKSQQAINYEVSQRLHGNSREFLTFLQEFDKYLSQRRVRYRTDPVLSTVLQAGAISQLREHVQALVAASQVGLMVNVFNAQGAFMVSYSKDEMGKAKQNLDVENSGLGLSDSTLASLEANYQSSYVNMTPSGSMELVSLTRLDGRNEHKAGFIEEVITIGQPFIDGLKKRLNLEILFLDNKGQVIIASQPDLKLYPPDFFSFIKEKKASDAFFDINIRGEPFRFIGLPVVFGDSKIYVGLGTSMQLVRSFGRNVYYGFFTMVGAIGVLLIIVSIFATQAIVQPVNQLVEATQTMAYRNEVSEIDVTSGTELGILQESFNEMSRRIFHAQAELKAKVQEVETAMSELQATQARLVHTAKMASLGQLVAGIAHELNNPIGFIYSNMSHLREYAERLVKIIDVADQQPQQLAKAKQEGDYDYIVKDLPRLISSCEDGARRTRDIVLGLRNFSRLDEAKLKRVDLREGLENTLRLLAGEIKNRITLHRDYQEVPEILCYASQINQVFMNILTNAAQAIEGEGDIWLGLRLISEDGFPPRVQISIRDSGKGMAADVMEKIFDPFFTTKGIGQGTGLGLSISYGIVKQHGGDIVVRSEPGKGTEFIMGIPVNGLEQG